MSESNANQNQKDVAEHNIDQTPLVNNQNEGQIRQLNNDSSSESMRYQNLNETPQKDENKTPMPNPYIKPNNQTSPLNKADTPNSDTKDGQTNNQYINNNNILNEVGQTNMQNENKEGNATENQNQETPYQKENENNQRFLNDNNISESNISESVSLNIIFGQNKAENKKEWN